MDPNLPQNLPSPNLVPAVPPAPPPPLPPLPGAIPPNRANPVGVSIPPNPSNPVSDVPPEIPSIHPPRPSVARQPTDAGGSGSTPPNPSKTKKSRKLLTGIVGLIILISALAGGLYAVGRQQLFQPKAAAGEEPPDFISCPNGTYCVPDHDELFCNFSTGDLCTYYIGECGYNPSPTCTPNPPGPGTGCQTDYYCRAYQGENVCIYNPGNTNPVCEWKPSDNCRPDSSCETTPPTPTPTATPIPTATPTPPPGVPQCISEIANPTVIQPGGSTTFTSTATLPADTFWYLMYNRDNLYPDGTPKPICVDTGFGDDGVGGDCAVTGTHQLMYKAVYANSRLTGSKVLNYDQLFVVDRNNSNQIVSRVQSNAYFQVNNGPWSVVDPNCVAYVSTQTSPTLTPTQPPATPTLPPGVVAQCTNILVQKRVGTSWQDIIDPATQAQVGDRLRFLVYGSTNNGQFTKAAFFINHSTPIEVTTPITIGSQTYFVTEYTLTSGSLSVEAVLYHSTEGWVD